MNVITAFELGYAFALGALYALDPDIAEDGFNESDHPRDKSGRFKGGRASATKGKEKKKLKAEWQKFGAKKELVKVKPSPQERRDRQLTKEDVERIGGPQNIESGSKGKISKLNAALQRIIKKNPGIPKTWLFEAFSKAYLKGKHVPAFIDNGRKQLVALTGKGLRESGMFANKERGILENAPLIPYTIKSGESTIVPNYKDRNDNASFINKKLGANLVDIKKQDADPKLSAHSFTRTDSENGKKKMRLFSKAVKG